MGNEQKDFSNWVQNVNALQITKEAFHEFALEKLADEMRTWGIFDKSEFLQFIKDIEDDNIEMPRKNKLWQCKSRHITCNTILNGLMQIRHNQTFKIMLQNELCKQIMLGDSAMEIGGNAAVIPKIQKPDALKFFEAMFGSSIKASSAKTTRKSRKMVSYDHVFDGCKKRHIWCIANMFMQNGAIKHTVYNTEPANTDAAMFFRMMKSCKIFIDQRDGAESKIVKVIECRNGLFHSPSNRVRTPDADANFTTLINLLEEYRDIQQCSDAIKKINEMRGQTIVFGAANKDLAKQALLRKGIELNSDLEIERSKGYSCDEIEDLLEETKELFSNQSLLQYSGSKSTQEFRKENKEYEEEIDKIKNNVTQIQIEDLEEELREQNKQVAWMSERFTDDPKHEAEVKEMQQELKNARSKLDELKHERIKVAESNDENKLTKELTESIEEIRKDFKNEQKSIQKELFELRKGTHQNVTQSNAITSFGNATHQSLTNVHDKEKRKDVRTETISNSHFGGTNIDTETESEANDSEDWYCDIDELDAFDEADEACKHNSDEPLNVPFEALDRSNKRYIASVKFGCTDTQFIIFGREWNTDFFVLLLQNSRRFFNTFSSTILLNQIKEVVDYGSEAKKKYDGLDSTQRTKHNFFFESLKINNRVGSAENLEIEDINGRSMKAVDLYSAAIKYMKGQVLKYTMSEKYKAIIEYYNLFFCQLDKKPEIQYEPITEDDIFWAFTEPAVSDVHVRSCVIEAAGKAGIQTAHLAVIPEPVAILAYCKHLPEDNLLLEQPLPIKQYSKYVIVDAGEKTVTLSSYEAIDENTFKEFCFAVEYPVKTDDAYKDFLTKTIGQSAVGERSTGETDVIILVGKVDNDMYMMYEHLKNTFPNKGINPCSAEIAAVVGAALVCQNPFTYIK